MDRPPSIFIGWDPHETIAYEVASWSISRRTNMALSISPLRIDHLESILCRPIEHQDGKLWCPISEAPMSTEFAISRFCVPLLQHKGWALFLDADILCLADVAELFALADERYAVQVVKHDYQPREKFKMDGQTQTRYSRKNWSSVVLWNCGHPANHRLTHAHLNHWPGRDLHAFKWLNNDEIGELPSEWNHLVGITEKEAAKILHFTNGGPWIENWPGGSRDSDWLLEKADLDTWKRCSERMNAGQFNEQVM